MLRSAGVLVFRHAATGAEFLLGHMGGPFWATRQERAWTIPKGLIEAGEASDAAARREFLEETGFTAEGPFRELGEIRQAGGKVVTAWAFEGNCNPAGLKSNLCEIEWPPRSGKRIHIPEIDRGEWFLIAEAREKILDSQRLLLVRLAMHLRLVPIPK